MEELATAHITYGKPSTKFYHGSFDVALPVRTDLTTAFEKSYFEGFSIATAPQILATLGYSLKNHKPSIKNQPPLQAWRAALASGIPIMSASSVHPISAAQALEYASLSPSVRTQIANLANAQRPLTEKHIDQLLRLQMNQASSNLNQDFIYDCASSTTSRIDLGNHLLKLFGGDFGKSKADSHYTLTIEKMKFPPQGQRFLAIYAIRNIARINPYFNPSSEGYIMLVKNIDSHDMLKHEPHHKLKLRSHYSPVAF